MVGDFDPRKLPGDTIALWRLVSRALLLRAEGCCEACGRRGLKINVHHKDVCGLNNNLENLIVLCSSCHMRLHNPKYNIALLPKTLVGGAVNEHVKKPTTMRV
jgi:hypothetical protein